MPITNLYKSKSLKICAILTNILLQLLAEKYQTKHFINAKL